MVPSSSVGSHQPGVTTGSKESALPSLGMQAKQAEREERKRGKDRDEGAASDDDRKEKKKKHKKEKRRWGRLVNMRARWDVSRQFMRCLPCCVGHA